MAVERIDSSADDLRREREVDNAVGTYAGVEAGLRQERRNAESFARRREALATGALQSLPEPERHPRPPYGSDEPRYNPTPDTSEPISPESLQALSEIADKNHDDIDARRVARTGDQVWVAAKRRAEDIKRGRITE